MGSPETIANIGQDLPTDATDKVGVEASVYRPFLPEQFHDPYKPALQAAIAQLHGLNTFQWK